MPGQYVPIPYPFICWVCRQRVVPLIDESTPFPTTPLPERICAGCWRKAGH
jgi:hypothetical protein